MFYCTGMFKDTNELFCKEQSIIINSSSLQTYISRSIHQSVFVSNCCHVTAFLLVLDCSCQYDSIAGQLQNMWKLFACCSPHFLQHRPLFCLTCLYTQNYTHDLTQLLRTGQLMLQIRPNSAKAHCISDIKI